ncbi:hypothetical protein K1T71_005485 [Dendrolimus kikuchii]|uniref:Uncharacterized protein n=1 Tax=Dendrolimus kikuchii TaxID=765133 RepID=A0ACC1D4B5_9NEOP|nr:hypothetical protein K1T71_005485 [Dendrolimus kikuchii]
MLHYIAVKVSSTLFTCKMNTITLMMTGLLVVGVIIVNGQNYEEAIDDYVEDEQHEPRKYRIRSGEQRYRRRKWRMGYGYDDQPYSHYSDRRNTYDRNEEVIPQIFKLLDDLSNYIKINQKQPPPLPPQFIYVPYPVPYPVPQYINCNPKTEDAKTNVC